MREKTSGFHKAVVLLYGIFFCNVVLLLNYRSVLKYRLATNSAISYTHHSVLNGIIEHTIKFLPDFSLLLQKSCENVIISLVNANRTYVQRAKKVCLSKTGRHEIR